MPINPSIIGNVMAPQAVQMPDVNAMLQTQTQGMENTFKIETARQQMAKEEAAAQQKEQEAATIKALLPAYTYGIQTGDIEGALNLAPPEMRDRLMPYVEALRGKPREEVQAALYGSLSASPEGQEALAAIQRSQTYGVQRGQLEVSQAKLDLDRQEAERRAAEAAMPPQPKPMTEYEKEQLEIKKAELKLAQEKADREASGALTDKQAQGKVSLDDTLSKIMAAYDTLKTEKAIVSQDNTAIENAAARASTLTGVTVGRTVGTKAQSARDTIANLRQSVLTDIKNATGMTSKEMDSNQDVQRLLASLGDPDQSYETILDTISNLSAKYGTGKLKAPGTVGGAETGGTVLQYDADGNLIE